VYAEMDECVGKIGYRVGGQTGFLVVDRIASEGEVFSMRDEVSEFLGSEETKENLVGALLGRDLLEPGREYALILMNAVQHRCSLDVKTEEHRDKVFRAMWAEEEVVACFEHRLRSYGGADGAIIVNACTRGNDTTAGEGANGSDALEELRQLVEHRIRRVRSDGSHLKVSHPSGWNIRYWDSTS
jgi:hypothetical protein